MSEKQPKIKTYSLENWPYGLANGCYEPFANEIHLLRGSDMELRVKLHEMAHYARRKKITFKLASLFNVPFIQYFLMAMLFASAFIFVLGGNVAPILTYAFVFNLFLLSNIFEEFKARQAVKGSYEALRGDC